VTSFTIAKAPISTDKNQKHIVCASPQKQISIVTPHMYILFILEIF